MSRPNIKELWEDILGFLRVDQPDLVRGWFVQLEPGELDSGTMVVYARNPAQQRYLQEDCARAFSEAAQAALQRFITFQFISQNEEEIADEYGKVPGFAADEKIVLQKDYTFDNFIIGPCNRLANAAAVATADSPGTAYNPLFAHGGVGLGKTHLLQAICHKVLEKNPSANILYISCETFVNHFLEAVERGALNLFRHQYRHVDMLVIDDIQFLAERERSQEEFFHTFNTLYQSQRQIILSSDSPPSQIPSLEDRLVSRFNSGLVVQMDPPCFETRMAIIRRKAKLRCISLSEEVVQFIASKVDSNIRELEGALTQIDLRSQVDGGRIDLKLAYDALGYADKSSMITIEDIFQAVTSWYNIKRTELQGKKRNKTITRPRQVCMYLARELTDLSLEEIGGYFGGRDHSTVVHAVKLIPNLLDQEPELKRAVEGIWENLRGSR